MILFGKILVFFFWIVGRFFLFLSGVLEWGYIVGWLLKDFLLLELCEDWV